MLEDGPGRFAEAGEMFKRAVAVDSNYASAWQALGLLSILRGEWTQAVRAYQQALRLHPDNLNAVDGLARSLVNLGQLDQAKPYVDRVRRTDLEVVSAYGTLLTRENRGPEAIPYLETVTRTTQPRAMDVATLAMAYASVGRAEDAVAAARLATSSAGATADVHAVAGHAMLRAGRPELARRSFQEALRIDPRSVSARQGLAAVGRPK
jgi:Flp pilus assembly protein TadD